MRTALVTVLALGATYVVAADLPVTGQTTDETLVAAIRFQGQYTDVGKYMEELMTVVGDKDVGPYIAIYYDGPEAPVHDVEVAVPVAKEVTQGNVKSRKLAGGNYARLLHLGPYEKLADSWMRLSSYVQMNELMGEGPGMEIYYAMDMKNPENNVTALLMPVKTPLAPAAAAPSNRFVHFEIPADDPARAVAFYTTAFGWKVQQYEGMDYWLCLTGTGPGIDGAIYKRAQPTDVTRNALAVADLDAAAKAVEAAGGKIVEPRMAVMGVGWLAYAADPEGNVFGMMQFEPAAK